MSLSITDNKSELINEIVSEVEKLDISERKNLLKKLKQMALLDKVKSLDKINGKKKTNPMNDKEADEFISKQRKMRYEQKQAAKISN